MFTSIGESKIPLGLLIFSSILNILMDFWMVAGLGLGVFGAALATLIAQGISAVFSLLIFFGRMRRYKSNFKRFDRQELYSMLQIAVPSVLQQSTVSIGHDDSIQCGCKSIRKQALQVIHNNESRKCFFLILYPLKMLFTTGIVSESGCKTEPAYQKRIPCCNCIRYMFCSSCLYSD